MNENFNLEDDPSQLDVTAVRESLTNYNEKLTDIK
jgi:hypothetical protein